MRTLGECLTVTVPSNLVEFSLSWRGRNSFDECSSAFEVPPATYNNLQGPGSTDRAGTQDTHKRTHTRTHKLQSAAKNPKVVFTTNNQMIQCIVPVQRQIELHYWLASKSIITAMGPRQSAHWYPCCNSPKATKMVLAVGPLVPNLSLCQTSVHGTPK